jgi:hypothetical protein
MVLGGLISAITPNNTTTTTELTTATSKAITTPTATPAHDAVLSKYLDAYYNASNIGGKVTAWQVTWLSGNSVKLQKSAISSPSGTNQKLTETDVITRFDSTSDASNYVQSLLGNAAYQKTLSGPFYAECWAYKQLTGQQPTICVNYDTLKSGNGNGSGKAITQSNEIVNTSDYVSVVA